MINMATLAEIKTLTKRAKQEERELIEARTEKNSAINALEELKKDVDALDVSDKEKENFKTYIDLIIKADGEKPDVNPLKATYDQLVEEADEKYNMAKAILDGKEPESKGDVF